MLCCKLYGCQKMRGWRWLLLQDRGPPDFQHKGFIDIIKLLCNGSYVIPRTKKPRVHFASFCLNLLYTNLWLQVYSFFSVVRSISAVQGLLMELLKLTNFTSLCLIFCQFNQLIEQISEIT